MEIEFLAAVGIGSLEIDVTRLGYFETFGLHLRVIFCFTFWPKIWSFLIHKCFLLNWNTASKYFATYLPFFASLGDILI